MKALGVRMGVPWFQLRDLAKKHGIVAKSSNYSLYGDMSARMMAVLGRFSPDQEIYSIDECFLGMDGFERYDLAAYGQQIRTRIKQWLGLPVCVGFGATKTLAKLANHVAKKRPEFGGVCDLAALSAAAQDALFASIDVGEVWGVGHRGTPRLKALGIDNVQALREADPTWLRREFSVVLERTVAELNGTPCIALEEEAPAKQQIMSSRAFGAYVYDLAGLEEAVATYVGRAAEKLRRQGSAPAPCRSTSAPTPSRKTTRSTSAASPCRCPSPPTTRACWRARRSPDCAASTSPATPTRRPA